MSLERGNVVKRFIAGAVCPRCSKMDKLVMYVNEQHQQVKECVSCGYQDIMQEEQPEEIKTRVNQPVPGEKTLAHEDEVQVVNIVDPGVGSKRRDH